MGEVIRPLVASDEAAATHLLHAELGGRRQARLGEVHDVLALSALGAWVDSRLVAVACYSVAGERAELAAVAVAKPWRGRGIGTRLVEAVACALAERSVRVLWLVTTNDNLDAVRLYQRLGFRLVQLRRGGVDEARMLKPSIPLVGEHGIPRRDELVLEREVDTHGTRSRVVGDRG